MRMTAKILKHACVLLCVAVFYCIGLTGYGHAATAFQVGFSTFGIWNAERDIRLDVAIWYPATANPKKLDYGPWSFWAARDARSAPGRFPLVLLSHHTAGTRFSYYNTAIALAKSGFVVVAPTHRNDNMDHMPHLYSVKQITERAMELSFVLDEVLYRKDIKTSIDPSRIGLLGFGVGGTAALLLGGATLDVAGWENFCKETGNRSPYCEAWAKEKMQKLAQALPLTENFLDVRIKAFCIVAPTYSMLFTPQALQSFSAPTLLIQAQKDTLNPDPWNVETMQESFFTPPQFLSVAGIDSLDFMAPCPEDLLLDLPDLCGKATLELRQESHQTFLANVRTFLLENLGRVTP